MYHLCFYSYKQFGCTVYASSLLLFRQRNKKIPSKYECVCVFVGGSLDHQYTAGHLRLINESPKTLLYHHLYNKRCSCCFLSLLHRRIRGRRPRRSRKNNRHTYCTSLTQKLSEEEKQTHLLSPFSSTQLLLQKIHTKNQLIYVQGMWK